MKKKERKNCASPDLCALLAVVDGAAVWVGGLGVGLALEELAARGGLEVHHRPAVRHLLRQPARLWGRGRRGLGG